MKGIAGWGVVRRSSLVIGLVSLSLWSNSGQWVQAEAIPEPDRRPGAAEVNTQPSSEERKAVAEYVRLGDRNYAATDYPEAVAAYSQALSLFPNNAYVLYNRGNAYRKLKDYRAALADYNRSLRLNPDHTYGYLYRGMTLQALGELDAAVTDFTRCIKRSEDKPVMFHRRGEAYHGLGKHDLAIADLEKAAKLYQSQKKFRKQSEVKRQLKKVRAAR